jgi:CheY-like chemotaxis protein
VALEKLRAQTFDLVLIDIQMPELDGLAVLDQMKSDMALRDVPVVMVSAVDDFDTVLRCIKLGADDRPQGQGQDGAGALLGTQVARCPNLPAVAPSYFLSLGVPPAIASASVHAAP